MGKTQQSKKYTSKELLILKARQRAREFAKEIVDTGSYLSLPEDLKNNEYLRYIVQQLHKLGIVRYGNGLWGEAV